MAKTATTATPRIYVACLASYNNGALHGAWIDADQDADDIGAKVAEMLKASPVPGAEEAVVHDYDNFPPEIVSALGETSDWECVAAHGAMIVEHGDAWGAYVGLVGTDYATESEFAEIYLGEWDSEEDFAREHAEDCGLLDEVPEPWRYYIDWDAWTRDLFIESFSSDSVHGGRAVYVFARV